MTPLRIALVVHGRFYMFDLARELTALGHEVTLFTNYPRAVCSRFGVDPRRVVSYLPHGVMSRGLMKAFPRGLDGRVERWCNTAFGRWAARTVPRRGPWDAVLCMSGVAEELFATVPRAAPLLVLSRASTHVREQKRILSAEQATGGGYVEQPSDWIVDREEREYQLADRIVVPSPFAADSFVGRGVPRDRLRTLLLGVDARAFTPPPAVIDERCRRLAAGEPLRVICVGNFSRQKGARVWAEALAGGGVRPTVVRFVGATHADSEGYRRALAGTAEFTGKLPQLALPDQYRWADLFALPSIQDGFPVVVTQALAAGVPAITTTSNGASAVVTEGETGWVIPPGRADLLAARIRWADTHRDELIDAVRRLSGRAFDHDWGQTAIEYARLFRERPAPAAERAGGER